MTTAIDFIGGEQMQTLTHQNLLIEGMVRMHRVTDVRIEVAKNEHA